MGVHVLASGNYLGARSMMNESAETARHGGNSEIVELTNQAQQTFDPWKKYINFDKALLPHAHRGNRLAQDPAPMRAVRCYCYVWGRSQWRCPGLIDRVWADFSPFEPLGSGHRCLDSLPAFATFKARLQKVGHPPTSDVRVC